MKKKTLRFIIPTIVAFVIYLILDYINLATFLGITPSNIDTDIFGVLFDAMIVIILYVISFYYIDNRQNEKDANARSTAKVLIQKTYDECLSNLKLLDNKNMVAQYIIPKVDGNKTDSEDKVTHNLQTLPFSSFDSIMSLATNGFIEEDVLYDYLDAKKEYQYLVSMKITFYDLISPQTSDQQALYNDIKNRDEKLKNKMSDYLKNCS